MRAVLIALSLALVGCGPAVVGEWEADEAVKDQRNRLTVDDLNIADATIWIFRTVNGSQQAQSFNYDVEWDERREGSAYSFDMTCKESPYGECDEEDDFRMFCDLEDDDAKLACSVDDNERWKAYPFSWHKLE
jgi:hypothetical protein